MGMDAALYIKEKKRMCDYYDKDKSCQKCPLFYLCANPMFANVRCEADAPEEFVSRVQRWSKEHPRKTNGQVFKEIFGFDPQTHWEDVWWDFTYVDTSTKKKCGKWIPEDDGFGGEIWHCSECDAVWTFNDGGPAENNANFCPECGADLRMTEHDNSED